MKNIIYFLSVVFIALMMLIIQGCSNTKEQSNCDHEHKTEVSSEKQKDCTSD